jgi:Flagellar hook-length control protein FliK
MQIPTLPQLNQGPILLVNTKNVLSLQTGEIVEAEVITVTDSAVAIRMKNSIIEARSNLPLKEGEVLSLLVEQDGQGVRLRIIQGNGDTSTAIKNSILAALDMPKELEPASDDIKILSQFIANASSGLRDILPELNVLEALMPSLEKLSGNVLKKAVQDSGVFFEAKLRLLLMDADENGFTADRKIQDLVNGDMKAALLSLKGSLGSVEMVEKLVLNGLRTDKLIDAVNNLLKNTELLQFQSKLSNTLQVFVPFVWQELNNGELIFRESGREHQNEGAYLCTINLDLEHAGRLSASLLLQAGQIYVDVAAENEKFSGILQDNREQLNGQFKAVGLKLGGLNIRQEVRIDTLLSRAGGLNIRI